MRTKDVAAWAKYKKVRNEVTALLRRANASFFREKIDSAKSTAAYLKILSEATNPKRKSQIGPIRREDNTPAVRDEEKANLINTFFATVGTSLSRNPACQASVETGNDPAPTGGVHIQKNQGPEIQQSRGFRRNKPQIAAVSLASGRPITHQAIFVNCQQWGSF